MSTRSNRLRRFSGAKVTRTSMSLSAVKSSLSTDPNRASSLTCHLRQKSSMAAIGIWMLVWDSSFAAMDGTGSRSGIEELRLDLLPQRGLDGTPGDQVHPAAERGLELVPEIDEAQPDRGIDLDH